MDRKTKKLTHGTSYVSKQKVVGLGAGPPDQNNKKLNKFFTGQKPNKQMKSLQEYLESATEAEAKQLFESEWKTIINLLIKMYDVYKQDSVKKVNPKKSDLEKLHNIFRLFLEYKREIVHKKFQIRGITSLLECLLDETNTPVVRYQGFDLLLMFIDDLSENTPQNVFKLIPRSIPFEKIIADKSQFKSIAIELAFTPLTGSGLNTSSSPSTKSAQEASTMFRDILIFLSTKATNFEFWWEEVIKKHLIIHLYPGICRKLGLVEPENDQGFAEHCPWEFQNLLIPQVLTWIQDPKISTILFSDETNLQLILEIFRQGFHLSFTHHKTMNDIISASKSATAKNRPPVLQKDLQKWLCILVNILSEAFDSRTHNELVNDQINVCNDIMNIFDILILEKHDPLAESTWEHLVNTFSDILHSLVCDKKFTDHSSQFAKAVVPRIVHLLFQTLLRGRLTCRRMWKDLESRFYHWIHWPPIASAWKTAILQSSSLYTQHLFRIEHTPSDFTVKLPFTGLPSVSSTSTSSDTAETSTNSRKKKNVPFLANVSSSSGVYMDIHDAPICDPATRLADYALTNISYSQSQAMFLWTNLFNLAGNINHTSQDPEIYCILIDTYVEALDLLLTFRKGFTKGIVYTPPPLIEFFAPVLLGSFRRDDAFSVGRATGIGACCRLFIRRHDTPVDEDRLAHFYLALTHAMTSLRTDKLAISAVLTNSCAFSSLAFPGFMNIVPLFISCCADVLLTSNAPTTATFGDFGVSIPKLRKAAGPVKQLASSSDYPPLASTLEIKTLSCAAIILNSFVCLPHHVPSLSIPSVSQLIKQMTPKFKMIDLRRWFFDIYADAIAAQSDNNVRILLIWGLTVLLHDMIAQWQLQCAKYGGEDSQNPIKDSSILIRDNIDSIEMIEDAKVTPALFSFPLEVLLSSVLHENPEVSKAAIHALSSFAPFAEDLMILDRAIVFRIFRNVCEFILMPERPAESADSRERITEMLFFTLLEFSTSIPNVLALEPIAIKIFEAIHYGIYGGKGGSTSSDSGPNSNQNSPRTTVADNSSSTSSPSTPIRGGRTKLRFGNKTRRPEKTPSGDGSSGSAASSENASSSSTGNRFSRLLHRNRDEKDNLTESSSEMISLAAEGVLMHLLNHPHNFPLKSAPNGAIITSLVVEKNDTIELTEDQKKQYGLPKSTSITFQKSVGLDDQEPLNPNKRVHYWVYNNRALISVSELLTPDKGRKVRIISRDMTGKYAWDVTLTFDKAESSLKPSSKGSRERTKNDFNKPMFLHDQTAIDNQKDEAARLEPYNRSQDTVPEYPGEENADIRDTDLLSHLITYIHDHHSDCHQFHNGPRLDNPAVEPSDQIPDLSALKKVYAKQQSTELKYLGSQEKPLPILKLTSTNQPGIPDPVAAGRKTVTLSGKREKAFKTAISNMSSQPSAATVDYGSNKTRIFDLAVQPQLPSKPIHDFQFSSLLLSQIGLLSLKNRDQFKLLNQTAKLFRAIKELDGTANREQAKIGVLYVERDQVDQKVILRNTHGSAQFEDFVEGLGWPVDVASHDGFLGKLDPRGTTGMTLWYYATQLLETVFHVATWMPTTQDRQQIGKKRHVGNDHIHIVWSEHLRDYSPITITSQFNHGHIVVYPLANGLFRVQIMRKENVPLFGPLTDGMVISKPILASIVRTTSILANRFVRLANPNYKRPYPTRRKLLDYIFDKRVMETSFVEFFLAATSGSWDQLYRNMN